MNLSHFCVRHFHTLHTYPHICLLVRFKGLIMSYEIIIVNTFRYSVKNNKLSALERFFFMQCCSETFY